MSTNINSIIQNQVTTLQLLNSVQRPGIQNLISYLEDSNFFQSPASTKYHNNFYGGLNLHCLNVYNLFVPRNRALDKPIPSDSEIIVSICHDLCKIGVYYHNGLSWLSHKITPARYAHGVLSIDILKQFIKLTPEEEAIIKFHMGLFSVYGYGHEYTAKELYEAIAKYPTVQIFASCDNEDAHSKIEV